MIKYALFHTGDLHTGAFRYLDNYLQRTALMFSEISRVVLAVEAEYRILAVVGDAFDRKNINEEERNLLLSFLADMAEAGVHVIVLNGNHDYYTEELTLLGPAQQMARLSEYLHVQTKTPGVFVIGDIGFGCVPCQQDMTTDQVTAYAKQLYVQARKPKFFYMLVHEAVHGAVNHKRTWKASSDKYLKIPDLPFVTGWMLADIHERQQVHARAWYCGAPLQVKADESETCGILQWFGSRPKFHQLDVPGFRYTDDVELAKQLAAEGHYVRFTGTASEKEMEAFPTNVMCTGDIAAIELDVDVAVAADAFGLETADLVTPLPKYLAKVGLNERQQLRGVEIVMEIRQMLQHRVEERVAASAGDDDEDV